MVALGALALANGAALPAAAGVVLDQATIAETGFMDPSIYDVFAGDGKRAFEQTVTVGKAGALDHIAVALFHNPNLDGLVSPTDVVAELFNTPFDFTSGSPSPLVSAVIPFASLPEDIFPELSGIAIFDVSAAHLHVNVGDTFTFSLRGGAGASVLVTAPYAGGGRLESDYSPGFPGNYNLREALAFRSYVDVPEPATWGLMLVGFAGLGGMLRRRRAAVAAA